MKGSIDKNVNLTDSKLCPTRLIEDKPAHDDLLAFHEDIGPHKRVAQAIAELIRAPEDEGGKMIGIEGGWGSGKTTVVNLIRQELSSDKDITIFSFDAWAHEGDPLRRTYLESLIRHFQAINWIDNENWNKKLLKLANRRKITTTRTVPKTTNLGKIFAISAFLVPFGMAFLTASLSQGTNSVPFIAISWMFWIGLIFTLAPFLVIGGNLFLICFKGNKNQISERATKDELKGNEKELSDWAFLIGNAITETKQDTTETPDPTSIEFEDDFRILMQSSLKEDSNRQAVLVLDNLDRVDPDDALTLWATLQTFLQDRNIKKDAWYKKLWIVVPYDPSGLRRLWHNRVSGPIDEPDIENSYAQIVPDSFIDKSFQLRFEVSPPVLSNWKSYLISLVEQALPEHTPEDQHIIYRVFNLYRAIDGESPTPRELKLYVNQIGVIHRQWQHEFPIGHVAYYALLRRTNTDIRKGLLEGEIPNKSLEAVLPSELRANLAGLFYNVRANLGQQLLLSGPIADTLEKNASDELQKLSKIHREGFWAILEDVVTSRFKDADAKAISNAALCLDQSKLLEDLKISEARTIMRELGLAAAAVENWSPFDSSLASGIATVCKLVSNIRITKKVVINLQQTFKGLEKKKEPPLAIEVVIAGLVEIFKEIHSIGHEETLSPLFILPVDAKDWVTACSHLAQYEPQLRKLFEPKAKFDEISSFLCKTITDGQINKDVLTAISETQACFIQCNWDALANSIEQRLNANQNIKSEEANLLFHAMSFLKQNNCVEANNSFKRLADEGHLMHCLHQAKSENHTEYMAWCIVTFLQQRPGAKKPQTVGNSDAGHNGLIQILGVDDEAFAKQVLRIIRKEKDLNLLLRIVDKRGQYDSLITRGLRLVAESDASEVLFTPGVIIDRWSQLIKFFDEESFNKLLRYLCEKTLLLVEIMKDERGFRREEAQFYLAIIENCISDSFLEWCKQELESLDAATWQTELIKEGFLLKLLLAILKVGVVVDFKQPYQDAIIEHAEKILDAKVVPSDKMVSQRLDLMAALATGASRKVLRKRLRDSAMDRDGKCADAFFLLYGDEISDMTTLTENNAIVSRLFSALVRVKSIGGLKWLRFIFDKNKDLLDAYNDEAVVQDFQERLQTEISKPSEEGNEAQQLINEIAGLIGIKPLKKSDEDDQIEAENLPEDKSHPE